MAGQAPIDVEIERVLGLSRQMLDAYLAWSFQVGSVHHMTYSDLTDYVNFRVETADTCLLLIEQGRIADALGLCRSVLEHYLLLILMCRGTKFFRLQNLEGMTTDAAAYLRQQQDDLAAKQLDGTTACLYVAKYPRGRHHLMYVFEGFNDPEPGGTSIPLHFFQFQEFQPETMRLNDADYFDYIEPSDELKKVQKEQRNNQRYRYTHYLSYEAMLYCLELNDLIDAAARARIEAHYTFLGRFLHPTHNAARDLHDRSNVHTGGPQIGMGDSYSKAAVLLTAVYVAYLTAGLLDELSAFVEKAPPKYVAAPGTETMRQLAAIPARTCDYFWFLFNEAPPWDKFNYAVHHVNDEALAEYGGYLGIPSDTVSFDQHIYAHLQTALGGWSNIAVGTYRSPLEPR